MADNYGFELNGVKVWREGGAIRVYAGVERPSWCRMDSAQWPERLMDGFMRQTEKEIAAALKAFNG